MRDCLTASTEHAPLDPTKRVNYNFGMVLGVDDFRQEQAHFEWKHQISNLLLHGYGTVCGLRVSAEVVTDPLDVQIRVSSGYGISREGRWMWVDRDLCGRLGEWLKAHKDEHSPPLGPGRQTVYVTLCYTECPTDLVSIVGQPCASDENTRAPSRVQEAYQVDFSWLPPPQLAEDLFRDFGDLMARVQVVPDGSPPADDRAALLQALRDLAKPGSPPLASPPDASTFELPASTACDTIREALAIWVTEVGPCRKTPLEADEKDCILLVACVQFDVDANGDLTFALDLEGKLVPGSIEVDNCSRPVLVPDRLKQELFCLIGRQQPSDLASVSDHGALTGRGDDDHRLYLPVDGSRPLTHDLDAGNNRIANLAVATADGQAVPFEQAVKSGDLAGGDLAGTYPDPLVAGLRGRPVANTLPLDGQVLTWNQGAGEWEPQPPEAVSLALDDLTDVSSPSPAVGDSLTWDGSQWVPRAERLLPFVTITRLDERVYELWFNIDAPGNTSEIGTLTAASLRVVRETDVAPNFLSSISILDIDQPRRNVFVLRLQQESDRLRFTFDISSIELATGETVLQNATKRGVSFVGQDGKGSVTTFARVIRN